ncbi:MAG: hypothetical protein GF388_04350 [Candidatus Aegiribacteria sp.]|nr:hypothetical protein [Candidatus Aegiribacteria sp.]
MLLRAKLVSVADNEAASALLSTMAEEYREPEYTGYINYELHRINGDDETRRIALDVFEQLYKNEGQSRTYRELINDLKNQEVSS